MADAKRFNRPRRTRRGLRVITELVINPYVRTAPWFSARVRPKKAPRRVIFYVWSDTDDLLSGHADHLSGYEKSN